MRKLLTVLFLMMLGHLTAWASDDVIVELAPNARAQAVAAAFGGQVVDSIPGTNHVLIRVPSLSAARTNPALGVLHVELNDSVTLKPGSRLAILKTAGSSNSEWYAQQPSFKLVRADSALGISRGRGIVIADLNARIDYAHPALVGHLTAGYDFVVTRASGSGSLNQSSASFLDQSSAGFLDQSSAGFLDQSNAGFLDQSSAGFLDQSTAGFLDQSNASFLDQSSASFLDATNPAHGHGTFCAGLIAAVAPDAMIMPLRVFDDGGNTDVFTIVRGIRYAVEHGADVINLSFGMASEPSAVKQALKFAFDHGVTVVASAGNNNTSTPQFPADFEKVMAIAATNLKDQKASFSNYGDTISVDAPGVDIISAYPGGYYAIASGTSFSAPIVAGEAALIKSIRKVDAEKEISRGTVNIDALNPSYRHQLGSGRIDMFRAMSAN